MTFGQFVYAVDIVLCIDATGSMSPVIEAVKSAALRFDEDLKKVLDEKGKKVDQLRVKVIVFRDFWADSEAILDSAFFRLPAERQAFSNFVSAVRADGGGSEPENGLEALALAIKSEWTKEGSKRRHVIVLWTDASAHELEKAVKEPPANYPTGLPSSLSQLGDWWMGQEYISQNAKRLLIFAPDATPWSEIFANWSQVIHTVSQAGKGLADHDYAEIVHTIANSIG